MKIIDVGYIIFHELPKYINITEVESIKNPEQRDFCPGFLFGIWHPSKVVCTFLDQSPFVGIFPKKL